MELQSKLYLEKEFSLLKKIILIIYISLQEKRNMNKAELILAVSEKTDYPKQDVEMIVDDVLDLIEQKIIKGEEVKISNFGVFYKKERLPRKGTNPSSGAPIVIPANNTAGFRPSKSLKAKLNK